MQVIDNRIHFDAAELKALAEENPTLFELAQRYPKVVDAVRGHNIHLQGANVSVRKHFSDPNDLGVLVCPSDVFGGLGPNPVAGCPLCSCWDAHVREGVNAYKRYPCWMRRWNDYVLATHTGHMYWDGKLVVG